MPTALSLIQQYHPQVKSVVDAKQAVRVDVTKEDSVKGSKRAPNKCAMARAFEREKDYDGAVISTSVSYLIKGDKAVRYKTPEAVTREIISFDRHADFAPGRYSLKPPGKTGTLEGKRAYSGNHKDARAKKRAHNQKYIASVPPGATAGYKNHKTAGVRSLN